MRRPSGSVRRCGRRRTTPSELAQRASGARFCLVGVGVEPAACGPEGDVDQADEHRHLDQRTDDTGEGLTAGSAEGADGDGDGELEVVACCGECQRRGAGVAETDALAEQDRKSTRLNSSHVAISYAVFCLK